MKGKSNTRMILALLDKHFKEPEQSDRWLQRKNIKLGIKPWYMILDGNTLQLKEFIEINLPARK